MISSLAGVRTPDSMDAGSIYRADNSDKMITLIIVGSAVSIANCVYCQQHSFVSSYLILKSITPVSLQANTIFPFLTAMP